MQKPASRARVRPRQGGASVVPGNPGNSGGKRGRSGRKPLEFKLRCAELADTLALDKVEAHLRSPAPLSDPATQFAIKYVTEYGKGKPAQTMEHTGEGGGPISVTVTRRIVRPPADGAAAP